MAKKYRKLGPTLDPKEQQVCESDPQFVATGEALLANVKKGAVAPHVFLNVVAHATEQALWRHRKELR